MQATAPLMDELRALPSDRLEDMAQFIHRLLLDRKAKRNSMIDATAGSLAGPVGDALDQALKD